ncbi:Glycosyltransferase protein (plasmid) [Ketogulonicigenium robustum]|uniref:Glycosyltransferase protein n=1 Tax=Ketogulonicigenium robustum TaxID=92947 RepID=A0A1W6P2Y7_9RHOB|nr:Glycosyltransferase protein [Ketogulonicigenium robustum]
MLGPGRAHWQDLWPTTQIDPATGDVTWRGQALVRLVRPSQILPRGLPLITVVGSGPSLREQRIEAIAPHSAILCNGAALLAERVQPLAVVVEDERFVFRHHGMLSVLDKAIPLFLSAAALRAFADADAGAFAGRAVALIDNLQKPVGGLRRDLSGPAWQDIAVMRNDAGFSRDVDRGVVITGTVAFSALQLAIAARPARILLAGIDLSNDAAPRFYEGADKAPSGLTAGLTRILDGFILARAEAARQNIALDCASPVSALLQVGYSYSDTLESVPLPV